MKFNFFSRDVEPINGLLDKGCSFEGKLTFDGTLQINGDFQGEIFSDGTLIVGPDARIRAKIIVDTLIVDGKVEGTAEAKSRIEIHTNAQFIGNVITPGLMVEDGGALHGSCQMHPQEQLKAEVAKELQLQLQHKEEPFAQGV